MFCAIRKCMHKLSRFQPSTTEVNISRCNLYRIFSILIGSIIQRSVYETHKTQFITDSICITIVYRCYSNVFWLPVCSCQLSTRQNHVYVYFYLGGKKPHNKAVWFEYHSTAHWPFMVYLLCLDTYMLKEWSCHSL